MDAKDLFQPSNILSMLAIGCSIWMYLHQRGANHGERLAKVETSLELILKVVGMYADKLLHHPVTPVIDHLIDKDQKERLTYDEAVRFANILQGIADNDADSGCRAMAALRLAKLAIDYELKFVIEQGE